MKTNLELRIHFDPTHAAYSVYVFGRDQHEVTHVGAPISMVPVESRYAIPNPTMKLDEDEIQRVMDDLWNAGIRPSHAGSASDVIEAKDAHIADMRLNSIVLDRHVTALTKKL